MGPLWNILHKGSIDIPLVQDILQVPCGFKSCCSIYFNVVEVIISNFGAPGTSMEYFTQGEGGGVSTTPLVQDILQVPKGSNACCSFYCNVVEVIICNFEHLGPLWNILHKGSIDISLVQDILQIP